VGVGRSSHLLVLVVLIIVLLLNIVLLLLLDAPLVVGVPDEILVECCLEVHAYPKEDSYEKQDVRGVTANRGQSREGTDRTLVLRLEQLKEIWAVRGATIYRGEGGRRAGHVVEKVPQRIKDLERGGRLKEGVPR